MAVYPGSAATDANLHVAVNNVSTTLNGGINNVTTTVVLTNASAFPTEGFVTIDSEAIHYTGKSVNTLTGVTRGADGTAAASHTNGTSVFHDVVAAHHNDPKNEIEAIETDLVAAYGSIPGATSMFTAMSTVNSFLFPTGGTIPFAGSSAPTGWLLCDGSVVAQATYPALFTAIGSTWNTGGEGAGNFRLPGMARRTAVGSGGSGSATLGNAVGNTGGEENHVITNAEMAATTVTVGVTDPGHGHNILGNSVNSNDNAITLAGAGSVSIDAGSTHPGTAQYRSVSLANSLPWIQANTTGITASGTVNGSGTGHNTIQPSAVFTWIIKT